MSVSRLEYVEPTAESLVRSLTLRYFVLQGLRRLSHGAFLTVHVLAMLSRGIDLGTIGLITAWFTGLVLLLELPTGGLADVVGHRRALLLAAACNACGFAVFIVATGSVGFVIAFGLLAVGETMTTGAGEAWLVDALQTHGRAERVQHVMARGGSVAGMLQACGALLGGAAPSLLALAVPRTTSIGLVLPVGVALIAELARLVWVVRLGRGYRLAPVSVPRPTRADRSRPRARMLWTTIVATFARSRSIRALLGMKFGLGFALYGLLILSQPRLASFMPDYQARVWLFGLVFAGASVAGAAGAYLSSLLVSRTLQARHLCAVLRAAQSVVLLGFGLAPSLVTALPLYFSIYLLDGWLEPVHATLVQERTAPAARASIESVQSMAVQLGGMAAALTLPRLAWGPAAPWIVSGLVILAFSGCYLLVSRNKLVDLGLK